MTGRDERLIVAIDEPEISRIMRVADSLRDVITTIKIGSTAFNANGPHIIDMVKALDMDVFLDLKFFDIPKQVTGAVRGVTKAGVKMFTIHAFGGIDMMLGAVEAAASAADGAGIDRPIVMAVTILTSIDDAWLDALGMDGAGSSAVLLARQAADAGVDGVVASAHEVAGIKLENPELKVLVPGIRADVTPWDDQKRIAAPETAIRNGADFLVVGRPVTDSADPAAAAEAILERMRG